MRLLCTVAVIAAVVTLAVGCTESTSPEELTIGDLAGTWVAESFEYTAVGNPALQVDLIAGGGSFTMTISASGTFSGTTIYAAFGTVTYTGTLAVSNDILTQDFDEEGIPTLTWTITAFEDDSMTIEGGEGPWDFSDDEVNNPVTASIKAVMIRQ